MRLTLACDLTNYDSYCYVEWEVQTIMMGVFSVRVLDLSTVIPAKMLCKFTRIIPH
jgi:hypothetical protein